MHRRELDLNETLPGASPAVGPHAVPVRALLNDLSCRQQVDLDEIPVHQKAILGGLMIERELIAMNRNSIEHQFLSDVVSSNLKQLRLAITGRNV